MVPPSPRSCPQWNYEDFCGRKIVAHNVDFELVAMGASIILSIFVISTLTDI